MKTVGIKVSRMVFNMLYTYNTAEGRTCQVVGHAEANVWGPTQKVSTVLKSVLIHQLKALPWH